MSLAIVGLGLVGASLGLALKVAIPEMVVTGHDPIPGRAAAAKKRGAIDKSHWNLPAACEQADIIVLDLPSDQIEATLAVLTESAPKDALIYDFSLAKRSALNHAAKLLPASVGFLGCYIAPAHTVLGGTEPSAGYFQGERLFLAVAPETSERAIQSAAGMADIIGATLCFTAPDELDSLIAAANQLPLLIALALASAWQEEGGWRDRQQALGPAAAWINRALAASPEGAAPDFWENRDLLGAWAERAIAALQTWRAMLADTNAGRLAETVKRIEERNQMPTAETEPSEFDRSKLTGYRQLVMGSLGNRLKGKR